MKLIVGIEYSQPVRSYRSRVIPIGERPHEVTAMRGSVQFHDERLELELPDEKLVGLWDGPTGLDGEAAVEAIRHALDQPLDFPPVRQAVVPGDRVAIALDASLGDVKPVLGVIVNLLQESGVEPGDVKVVTATGHGADISGKLPPGVSLEPHDDADRRRLAYLATTKAGRRIYLNRQITDADVVIPVGRLGYDPILGYRGPWSVIFPGLSDQVTAASYRQGLVHDTPGRVAPRPELEEAFEVSWLLGTQFHLGLLPGRSGLAQALCGLAEPVRDRAIGAVDRLWSFRPASRAECVIAGIGRAGVPAGIDELVEGLVTASRLVTQGGKIVALSQTQGVIGPVAPASHGCRRPEERTRGAAGPRRRSGLRRGPSAGPGPCLGRRLSLQSHGSPGCRGSLHDPDRSCRRCSPLAFPVELVPPGQPRRADTRHRPR